MTQCGPAPFARRVAAWTLDAVPASAVAVAATWRGLAGLAEALAAPRDALVASMVGLLDAEASPGGAPAALLAALAGSGLAAQANALATHLVVAMLPTAGVFALAMVALHVAGECGRWRGSPGKRLLGLHVAPANDPAARMSPGRSLARNVAGTLSWVTLNLGHAWALVPPAHQALHDRIARTQVYGPNRPLPPWATAWLWLAGAGTLALPAWLFQWMHDGLAAALGVG